MIVPSELEQRQEVESLEQKGPRIDMCAKVLSREKTHRSPESAKEDSGRGRGQWGLGQRSRQRGRVLSLERLRLSNRALGSPREAVLWKTTWREGAPRTSRAVTSEEVLSYEPQGPPLKTGVGRWRQNPSRLCRGGHGQRRPQQ